MAGALLFVLFLSSLSTCYSSANEQQDVYEELWNINVDLANKTLFTDFMQQMQNNSLKAERYLNFTLQDINYLIEVTDMLEIMSKKVQKPKDISDFLTGRYKSYKGFLDFLKEEYLFKKIPSIKSAPAMRKYLATYREVMAKEPIYFAVALLPCSRLWVWLAENLNMNNTNVYYNWKKDNSGGNHEKHYKVLLNRHLNTTVKVNKAKTLFRTQMQNEHDFFATS